MDGGWGPWRYGGCSLTCGNGTLVRTRECNNPPPAYQGNNCEGPSREVLSCYEGCCPGIKGIKLHLALHTYLKWKEKC